MTPMPLPRRIRRMLADFARQPGVTRANVAAIQWGLDHCPRLQHQLDESIRSRYLRGLLALPLGAHIGGSYNGESRLISVPLQILTPQQRAEMIFVLGHELQHALNFPDASRAEDRFFAGIETAQRSNYDYTPVIERYIADQRLNESSANLAGWNALADYVRTRNPYATLDDVAIRSPRCQDFVSQSGGPHLYTVKPGLSINPDLTFDLTPSNIGAMARYYFDKSPEQLGMGALGSSDYLNQYGAGAISQAAACHRYATQDRQPPPIMIINTTQLGLSRKIMEENGIDLESHPIQPYLDCSTDPPRVDFLHHTITTHQYVPVDQQPPARPAPAPDRSAGIARRMFARPPTWPERNVMPPDAARTPDNRRQPGSPRDR